MESWQRPKRALLRSTLASALLFIACAHLRFMPSLNDALSGKPEYMRWIAEHFARSLVAKSGDAFPVMVLEDEKNNCHSVSNARVDPVDDLYYVILYSDVTRSVCFLTCAEPIPGWSYDYMLNLNAETGRNYGRRLTAPKTVAPIGQYIIRFPASYVALLHWRGHIDQAVVDRVEQAQARGSVTAALPQSFLNVTVNFDDLRAAVARRHDIVNAVLAALMLACLLLAAVGAVRLWFLHRGFRARLLLYDAHTAFWPFLRGNLAAIARRAREIHQCEQERLHRATRAAALLRQSKEAIRGRLESLRKTLPDQQQRLRIETALEEDNVGKMNALVAELHGLAGQKTAEEKLTSLLDTLQDFCRSEEFDACCVQAFRILATAGFREARAFVVEAHEHFRNRSKEVAQQEIVGAPE